MFENRPVGLYADFDADIVLKSVDVDAVFNNLLCETVMNQVYQNLEKGTIEAVYTFPLSSQAVLLGFKICIGDSELNGVIVEKSSAESQYEDALIEGNAAIMLEQVESGIYTINVGNILPGETVSITIQYAELYCWQNDTIRYLLPTTIAPKYGDPEIAGLQPHQIPEATLLTENNYRLRITIIGDLADSICKSPTHQIAVQNFPEKTIVTLAAGQAFMDRDFILNMGSIKKEKNMAVIGNDLDDGYVALASFVPNLPVQKETSSRSIKILVDCSGSMAGDSINQARQAVNDLLSFLKTSDFLNIFTFGNSCRAFFEHQVPANKKNLTHIRRQLRSLDANMGGTEMNNALRTVIIAPGPAIPQDIFLITDGEVWEEDKIIKTVKESGHRVFTVGVGSAVSEGFLRRIATETDGACELVTPKENMAEKIVRHFKRIFLPQADCKTIKWPITPKSIVPQILPAVFDGDTLHVFAFFDEKPTGNVSIELTLANGQSYTQSVMMKEQVVENPYHDYLPGTIARIGVQKTLKGENKTNAVSQALKYQLISPWTNYIIVSERSEDTKNQGQDLPALRKVPQMMAAGWGGVGKVKSSLQYSISCSEPTSFSKRKYSEASDIPLFLRMEDNAITGSMYQGAPDLNKSRQTPLAFIFSCNRFHKNINDYSDLLNCRLPDVILSRLQAIAKQYAPDLPESLIVNVFLKTLADSKLGGCFNRTVLRSIKREMKSMSPGNEIIEHVEKAFANITADDWG